MPAPSAPDKASLKCELSPGVLGWANRAHQGVNDLSSVKAVDAHYEAHFGSEPEYWSFTDHPDMVGVLEWPKGTSRHRFHMYATLGLHALIHGPLNHKHGFELYTCVSTGNEDIRLSFALMANYLISDGITVQPGQLVTPTVDPIFEGLDFTSWLMLERTDDFIPPLQFENEQHVIFLDATPVFPEEAQHLKDHGLEGLFDLWDEDPPRLSDLNRTLPQPLVR